MAFFHNPRGVLMPEEWRGHFGLPANTRIVFGTDEDDVFLFDGAFRPAYQTVVFMMGGSDTYNGALNAVQNRVYSGYPQEDRMVTFGLDPRDWDPDSDEIGFTHIGSSDQSKGQAKTVLHGGHYGDGGEAQVWLNHPDSELYMAGREIMERGSFETIAGTHRVDFDGRGYTAKISQFTIEGYDSQNPITTGQRAHVILRDQRNGMDHEDQWIDYASRSGPTDAEQRAWVDNWDAIL